MVDGTFVQIAPVALPMAQGMVRGTVVTRGLQKWRLPPSRIATERDPLHRLAGAAPELS